MKIFLYTIKYGFQKSLLLLLLNMHICSFVMAQWIHVFDPFQDQILVSGSEYKISWNASLTINYVNIEYSMSFGNSWISIIDNLSNMYEYDWIVPDTPSPFCIIKVSKTGSGEIFGLSGSFSIYPDYSISHVLTPNRNKVTVLKYQTDFSQEVIDFFRDGYMLQGYEVIGDASIKYNCHAFAWHISEGNLEWVWMNDPHHKQYWEDQSYVEVDNELECEKIFYSGGDHSAIKTNQQGIYVSKWGMAPKIKHKWNNCPYLPATLKYFRKSGSSICYILDRSGSMQGAPMANAKAAAIQGIYSMNEGDEVSVVSFDATAGVNYFRKTITGNAERQAAANAVNSINAGGWTSIGAGLLTGYNVLAGSDRKSRDYVLLTDGDENTPPWVADVIHLFQNLKSDTLHRIHTIAFGEWANQQQMAWIAQLTGGQYAYSQFQNDPMAIMNIYNTIQNEISGGQTLLKLQNHFSGFQTFTHNIIVDSTITESKITLIWDNNAENLSYKLISPSNQEINESNWSGYPEVNYVNGPGIKYYTIKYADAGTWKAEVSSTSSSSSASYALVHTALSTMKMSVYLDKPQYSVYEPIQIRAELFDLGDPLPGSEITVNVTKPSKKEGEIIKMLRAKRINNEIIGEEEFSSLKSQLKGYCDIRETISITLYDDGNHGDGKANDGIFANWFKQTENEGTYSFQIDGSGVYSGIPFQRKSTKDIYVEQGAYVSQTISMPAGWSGISSNVIQFNPLIEQIMSGALDKQSLVYMMSDSGVYIPSGMKELESWENDIGYLVKLNIPEVISFRGHSYSSNNVVNLRQGQNIIPVKSSNLVPTNLVFNKLGKNLKFVLDLTTGRVFSPTVDLYTLQHLTPGNAYLVDVYHDCAISYPTLKSIAEYESSDYSEKTEPEKNYFQCSKTSSPHVIAIHKDALKDFKTGDILIAHTSDSVCAGMIDYNGEKENVGLIVYGDDFTTNEKDGFIANELILLELFRPSTGKVHPIKVTYDQAMPNSDKFEVNGLSYIIRIDVGDYSDIYKKDYIINVYPNPYSEFTVIEIPDINASINQLIIYDLAGKPIRKIVDVNSNSHTFSRDGLKPGVYLIKCIGDHVYLGKMIVY